MVSPRRFSLPLLLACALWLAPVGRAGEPPQIFAGPAHQGLDADFQRWHTEFEAVGDYGESWFYVVMTEEGGALVALLSVTNLGLRTFDGSVDVDWYAPDGSVHKVHHEVHRDQMRAEPAGAGGMTLGPARTWGGEGSYHLSVQAADVDLSLDLANTLPEHRFGDGRVTFDGAAGREWTTGWNTPRARSSGALTVDGQSWSLAGDGYGDHGWATLKVPDFLDAWYSARLFNGDGTTLLLHDLHLDPAFGGGHLCYGLLGIGGQVAALPRGARLEPTAWREGAAGNSIPTTLQVKMDEGGYKVSGTLREERFLESIDVFGRLSWPVRTAIKTFYTQVWIHRLLASYQLDITDPTGRTRRLSGLAFVEVDTY